MVAALILLAGCQWNTTRPPFPPVVGATEIELELDQRQATEVVARAMRADSLPLNRVEPRDGLIESPWFDARSMHPTGQRILGSDIVRIRAWIDPTRPGHTKLTLEAVHRPFADPARPDRELDQPLPMGHPIAVRMDSLVALLGRVYGADRAQSAPAQESTQPSQP